MYPGHWHYHWHRFGGHRGFHGGPSRLLWFIFGGVTASWWYHHKHTAHIEGSSWGACNRHHIHRWSAVRDRASNSEFGNEVAAPARWQQQQERPVQLLPTGLPPLPAEEDKFRAFGNQAVDSMSELSEATLDNILSTVQSLKVKIAENRLARAKEEEQQRQQQQQQEIVQSPPSSSRGWDALRRII